MSGPDEAAMNKDPGILFPAMFVTTVGMFVVFLLVAFIVVNKQSADRARAKVAAMQAAKKELLMTNEATESLIGVSLDPNGHAVRTTQHVDGSQDTERLPAEHTPEPTTHSPQTVGALEERLHHGLTRAEHTKRSLRVEAALLQCFHGTGSSNPRTGQSHISNRVARAMMVEVLEAMGGDWKEKASLVLLTPPDKR